VIVFARHGQTAPNRDGLVLGRADPELTDEGRRQAEFLAAALAEEPLAQVLTSPLVRARQTAEAISAACGLPVTVDERLVEIDWGTWEGRPAGSLAVADVDRWRNDDSPERRNGDPVAPEGESLESLSRRVESFCLDTLDQGLVVAVSHVSPIKAATAWALGVDGTVAWRMFLGLASITRVGRGRTSPVLLSFNETGHLRPAEERDTTR
jgi:broad specificity phosphatase PhoE